MRNVPMHVTNRRWPKMTATGSKMIKTLKYEGLISQTPVCKLGQTSACIMRINVDAFYPSFPCDWASCSAGVTIGILSLDRLGSYHDRSRPLAG